MHNGNREQGDRHSSSKALSCHKYYGEKKHINVIVILYHYPKFRQGSKKKVSQALFIVANKLERLLPPAMNCHVLTSSQMDSALQWGTCQCCFILRKNVQMAVSSVGCPTLPKTVKQQSNQEVDLYLCVVLLLSWQDKQHQKKITVRARETLFPLSLLTFWRAGVRGSTVGRDKAEIYGTI